MQSYLSTVSVKQSSRKKHQAIRDRTEELAFFEYPKRSRCQCDHLQHHGNGKGKRSETVRILSAPAGGIAAGKHKAVMPANTPLAGVTAFFMPYVRMV